MSSVKYKLDSLMFLRAIQVVLTMELFNLGYRVEVQGVVGGSLIPNLLALVEVGLLIIVWAMRINWRAIVNLYVIIMTGLDLVWILSLVAPMLYLLGISMVVLILVILRVLVLARLNYTEGRETYQPHDGV